MKTTIAEEVARRDRVVVFLALISVVCVSALMMQRAGDQLMRAQSISSALLFVMWWTMMLAMMLPSAAPAILLFGAMARRTAGTASPDSRIALFAAGYAAVWTGFSLAATGLHLVVETLAPLTPMMAVTGRAFGGFLLIAAGLYQLSPFKSACLRHCQSPVMFMSRHWQRGAFRMGSHHGLYCLGCCAVLMAVLFYGGVMEPLWIGGLALYVLVEKVARPAWPLTRMSGLLLVVWGLLVLAGYL